MPNYLTIDNGGTNTKVTIFNELGESLGISAFPTKAIERKTGFHEIDLTELWKNLGIACQAVLKNANLTGNDIACVATVGHGKGLYVLDKNGQPFMNGILSTDGRASHYAQVFESKVDQIFQISHQHVMVSQAPVILRWLKDEEPENYQKIGSVLSNKDFIRYLITGEIFQEIGDASGNNFVNLTSKAYDSRLFNFFGIPEMIDNMPRLIQATERCGQVSQVAEEVLGIKAGTPVVGGMFDIDACAIATGVLDDTQISLIAGTWNMNILPSVTMAKCDSGLMNSIFPTNRFLIEASSPTSAGNLAIIINMLMNRENQTAKEQNNSIYDDLEHLLKDTDAKFAKMIFFPFLYGSNSDNDASGAFIGLRSTSTKLEMLRAVYEGIAFAHRDHVEKLLGPVEKVPTVIRMSGGATNSSNWVQMFSNVLNMPIELPTTNELGGLGGAIAASVGSGFYRNIEEAVKHMSHVKSHFVPQKKESEIYNQKYKIYESMLHALDGKWQLLRSFQEGE